MTRQQDRIASLKKLIPIAAAQFQHDDSKRRLIMLELTGKASMRAMDLAELEEVYSYYKDQGFTPKKKQAQPTKKPMRPKLAKLFSLWQEMADAGLVHKRTFKALESWATKNCKGMNFDRAIDKLDWFTDAMLHSAIEQLKAYKQRLEAQQEKQVASV